LVVLQPNGLGTLNLLPQFWNHRWGDGHHPVFAALGPEDEQRQFLELNIFNAQIERFTHPQPAAVEETDNQVGVVTRPIPNGLEQGLGLGDRRGMAQAGWPSDAESIKTLKCVGLFN